MNLTTVTVSGQINQPGGAPAAHASVRFALSALGVDGLALVVPRYADAVCDAQGAFAAQVVPSPAGTYYDVRIGWDDALLVRVRAVVPARDCQFSQIMQVLPYPPIDAAQRALLDLQAAQAAIEIDRQGAAASAADALQSQEAARVSAAAAADDALQAAESQRAAEDGARQSGLARDQVAQDRLQTGQDRGSSANSAAAAAEYARLAALDRIATEQDQAKAGQSAAAALEGAAQAQAVAQALPSAYINSIANAQAVRAIFMNYIESHP